MSSSLPVGVTENKNDLKKELEPEKNEATKKMLHACASGDIEKVRSLLESSDDERLTASKQDEETGKSPLMEAAKHGHYELCQLLLDNGAPWNAIDRCGQCAGNYATDAQHWDVVNLLVDAGTKAELILGATIRLAMQQQQGQEQQEQKNTSNRPVEHEPCTKPDYLQRNVRYNDSNKALLDDENDAVMMEWERPLMDIHASIITSNSTKRKRVLNVGFGMGIIDTALQKLEPSLHIIIEAHPIVYQKMISDGWHEKENVKICFGRWQDVLPKIITEEKENGSELVLDGIFYDTYGEHFTDLEDFQLLMSQILAKPDGIYSFFNGLAPDNLFFHGVACQCVKLQLAKLGLDSEFAPCDIQVRESEWEGVRRKYWHGRETYYLPIVTWNGEYLKKEEDTGRGCMKALDNDSKECADNNVEKKKQAGANDGHLEKKKMKTNEGSQLVTSS